MLLVGHSCRTAVSSSSTTLVCTLLIVTVLVVNYCPAGANPDAKRLYDDLLSHYNRLIRPVSNNSEVVTVRLGLHLSQLIDLVSLDFISFHLIVSFYLWISWYYQKEHDAHTHTIPGGTYKQNQTDTPHKPRKYIGKH